MVAARVRTALITGASGGIGTATTIALATAGYRVIGVGRSLENLAVLESLTDGLDVTTVRCDVTDEEQVADLVGHLPHVDVLVNNAGRAASAPVISETVESWNELFRDNATSAFLMTRAFLPAMIEADQGRLIYIASTSAIVGERYIASYTASKHAMLGLARSVAAEVAGSGVTSNAICPTYVRTPMTERSVRQMADTARRTEADVVAAVVGRSTLGRLIEPSEVADAVAYFAMEGAAAVNGQSLVIDGGRIQG